MLNLVYIWIAAVLLFPQVARAFDLQAPDLLPPGWRVSQTPGEPMSVETDVQGPSALTLKPIPLDHGQLRITCRVISPASGRRVWVSCTFLDGDGKVVGWRYATAATTPDHPTSLWLAANRPAVAKVASVTLGVDSGAGRVMFRELSAAAHDSAPTLNFCPNPSFEAGLPHNDKVYDWQPQWQADFSWAKGIARDGERSLCVAHSPQLAGWHSQPLPVWPFLTYRLSGWLRSKAGGRAYLAIAWFGPEGWIRNSDCSILLSGDREWIRTCVADRPPPDATSCQLFFRADGTAGQAWADALRFDVTDDWAVRLPLPDSSFENATAAWRLDGGDIYAARTSAARTGSGAVCLRAGQTLRLALPLGAAMDDDTSVWFGCWARCAAGQQASAQTCIEWLRAGAVVHLSPGPELAVQQSWQPIGVQARRPPNADAWRPVVRCVRGQVVVDDCDIEVSWPPEGGTTVGRLPEVHARLWAHLQALFPFRLLERASEAGLLAPGAALGAWQALQQALGPERVMKADADLRRAAASFAYHAGLYEQALELIRGIGSNYSTLDLKRDIALHYERWAQAKLEEQRRQQEAADLLRQASEKRGSPDALLRLGRRLAELEAWRELLEMLKPLSPATIPKPAAIRALSLRVRALLATGQLKQAGEGVQQMAKLAGGKLSGEALRVAAEYALCLPAKQRITFWLQASLPPPVPGAAYLGDDMDTNAHWPPRYGGALFIICGGAGGNCDIRGGRLWPLPVSRGTTDPGEPGRVVCTEWGNDPSWLFDPARRTRVHSWWDDRGETHPYDNRGPDLLLTIPIPRGPYRLALRSREHRVTIEDSHANVLAEAPARQKTGGYRCFIVVGPADYTVHIHKGRTLCAVLEGVFVDGPYVLEPIPNGLLSEVPGSADNVVKDYAELIRDWANCPWAASTIARARSLARRAARLQGRMASAAWVAWQTFHITSEPAAALASLRAYLEHLSATGGADALISFVDTQPAAYPVEWAIVALEKAAAIGALTTDRLEALANLYLRAGQDSRALAVLKQIARAEPTAPRLLRLAAVLIGNKRLSEARAVLERLQHEFPDTPDAVAAERMLSLIVPDVEQEVSGG